MDLNLIENSQKKKKNTKNLSKITNNLLDSINSIVDFDIKKDKKNEDSMNYIKENLKDFIELYININRNIKNINNKNHIVEQIVKEMLNNVFMRCENLDEPDLNCIIDNFKESDKKIKVNVTMNN